MGKRTPRNARPRRHTECFRHVLRIDADAEIQGQPRGNNPVILSVKSELDIRDLKCATPGEFDALDGLFARSQDVYRVLPQLAVLRAARDIRPDLEIVRSPSGEGSKGVAGPPARPGCVSGLIGEIIPAVAHGSDGQILAAFAPHPDIGTHGGEGGFEQASE